MMTTNTRIATCVVNTNLSGRELSPVQIEKPLRSLEALLSLAFVPHSVAANRTHV